VTVPIWIALPPEVHSTLLSSGPGPGPLLEAAGGWSLLSTEYAQAADELTGILGAVQGGAWSGPSAEQYVAAHGPYLTWLLDSATKSAAAAAQHELAATAYTTALATMPTLAELAANHAIHGVLTATNFFGLNTIPIALNEADYVRMWIQAAETMTAYQGISESALAAVPTTEPSPQIVSPGGEAAAVQQQATAAVDPLTSFEDFMANFQTQLASLLSDYTQGFAQPLGELIYPNGWPFDAHAFTHAISSGLLANIPGLSPTLATALAWTVFHTLVLILPVAQVGSAVALVAAPVVGAAGVAAAAGAAVGIAVPAAIGAAPSPAAPPVVPAPASAAPVPALGGATSTVSNIPTMSSTPAPAPATPTVGGPVGGGPPGVGFGPTASHGLTTGISDSLYAVGLSGLAARGSAGSRSRRKSEEPAPDDAEAPAAAAAAAAKERVRARRHRGGTIQDRAYRYEFMDPDETVIESGRGADPLGFAGAAAKSGVCRPAGLATLPGDGLSDGPRIPMVPSSWGDETSS
jgi:PPE-repeat protein